MYQQSWSRELAEIDGIEEVSSESDSVNEGTEVEEARDDDAASPPSRYNVSSHGWDSDVEGLVKRLVRGNIFIPGFQRRFVWSGTEKSRFIESLILGLPVPNVFLAEDAKTKKLNIVDGQQRLMSLKDYLLGEFYLTGRGIQEELRGCYFSREVAKTKTSKVLSDRDARTLSDAVLHSIVIKPDSAYNDSERGNEYNQSIIQIFRRLNTSGNPLQAHEVRASILYGQLDDLLRNLNEHVAWRKLFGEPHLRLRDMELILRFIALREDIANYRSPMSKFLDNFMEENREMSKERTVTIGNAFKNAADFVMKTLGRDGLRSVKTIRVLRFDAVMIGFDAYLESHPSPSEEEVVNRLGELDEDRDYIWSTEEFVNETSRVQKRIERVRSIFGA